MKTYLPSEEESARLVVGVGALIRAEREARGFSCRRLARRAALSHDHVRRIEPGHRRPGRTALRAIAYGFQVSPRARARTVGGTGEDQPVLTGRGGLRPCTRTDASVSRCRCHHPISTS